MSDAPASHPDTGCQERDGGAGCQAWLQGPAARGARRGGQPGPSSYCTGTAAAAFFRLEPAVTLAVCAAAISIDSPVCGLRPVRAERCPRSTVISPGTATLSPRVMASTSSSCRPLSTWSTVAEGTSARLAMAETSSDLFIWVPLTGWRCPPRQGRTQSGVADGGPAASPVDRADPGASTVPSRCAPGARPGVRRADLVDHAVDQQRRAHFHAEITPGHPGPRIAAVFLLV